MTLEEILDLYRGVPNNPLNGKTFAEILEEYANDSAC